MIISVFHKMTSVIEQLIVQGGSNAHFRKATAALKVCYEKNLLLYALYILIANFKPLFTLTNYFFYFNNRYYGKLLFRKITMKYIIDF